MRFGLCCSPDIAGFAMDAGFDYVELPLSGLHAMSDRSLMKRLPIEATNVFFPSTVRLFGPEASPWAEYSYEALSIAAELGVQIAVLGSGNQRRAPEDGNPEWEDAFADDAQHISRIGKRLGVTVAPESLNRSETNVANDLGALARRLEARGVAYTADVYHMLFEWNAERASSGSEDDRLAGPSEKWWTEQLPHAPVHVHLADLPRHVPSPDDPMLSGFVARLRALEYNARVSLEAKHESTADALRHALANMRALFVA